MSKKNQTSGNGGTKDQDQWVMITPESTFTQEEKPTICKLRHPKSGIAAMFMFTHGGKTISEILKFDDPYRSWFIGQTIQQDGSLLMTTPVDPLFLILPYLIKSKQDKFIPLDQQLVDEDLPECGRLCHCIDKEQLHLITEVKGPDDLVVCKYDQDKTLRWLAAKVEKVADFLETRDSHANSKRDDVVRYSHGIVSDYLPADLSETLKNHMGIKTPLHEKPTIQEPPNKKQKVEPLEDYSSNGVEKKDEKKGKTTTSQAKLAKVDKSGMKSISSFFAAKPKVKK